ncbi:MAG: DUF4956 domain-containing protein, partial [Prevotella sp.]|nr:DUF4956 domain-containing protein [Prevotella sp.]
ASLAEILVTDFIVTMAIWFCEKSLHIRHSKLIQYDRIELTKPERKQELIADLEERLGLTIKKVEVGGVDLLRDMTVLRVYYDDPTGKLTNSGVANKLKLKPTEMIDHQ